jgi:hypothetical protein
VAAGKQVAAKTSPVSGHETGSERLLEVESSSSGSVAVSAAAVADTAVADAAVGRKLGVCRTAAKAAGAAKMRLALPMICLGIGIHS